MSTFNESNTVEAFVRFSSTSLEWTDTARYTMSWMGVQYDLR